jgi:hypothetical protein
MTMEDNGLSVVQDYAGLVTNTAAGSGDFPPGTASLQTNAMCVRDGELTSRFGYRVVQFEGE